MSNLRSVHDHKSSDDDNVEVTKLLSPSTSANLNMNVVEPNVEPNKQQAEISEAASRLRMFKILKSLKSSTIAEKSEDIEIAANIEKDAENVENVKIVNKFDENVNGSGGTEKLSDANMPDVVFEEEEMCDTLEIYR
ncbi:hypothetical protein L6452_06504 [Arctium lappa]|uniref:Uncharacterized protein n=1 Tax=Arctium lappa TaxID=4217 RepID=A0ACB9EJS8_ARCLA|nr:hypothetical protein L6452_06504 [Arctium lappa]